MRSYLDFEKPVAELDAKVDELRVLAATGSDIGEEISRIEDKAAQALGDLYANLTPWQKTLVARHPQRPHLSDFINARNSSRQRETQNGSERVKAILRPAFFAAAMAFLIAAFASGKSHR